MAGGLPIPAGVDGVGHKEQYLRSALSVPLTPEKLWWLGVQSQRGFLSSPNGPADTYRKTPATLPNDVSGNGAPVGKGYETFAAIQVLDKDGRRLAIGADYFYGGDVENHGEARAIRGLERHGPVQVSKGKLMVVSEKDPCSSCEQRLVEFARKRGITEIEVYLPQRAYKKNPTRIVTAKQAALTSFMGGLPPITFPLKRSINVPDGGEMLGIQETAGVNARTAVIGTLANIGPAAALSIFQAKFKDDMLKSLENMPKPKVDRGAAADYFSDPATGKAIRVIDLLSKNLGDLISDLQELHQIIIRQTRRETSAIDLSIMTVDARIAFLTGLGDQLHVYGNDLRTLRESVEAARRLETKSLDAAKRAEDLATLVGRTLIADRLLQQGFSLDEVVPIYENLTSYVSRVRRVFQDLATLQQKVENCIDEQSELAPSVKKIYLHITFVARRR